MIFRLPLIHGFHLLIRRLATADILRFYNHVSTLQNACQKKQAKCSRKNKFTFLAFRFRVRAKINSHFGAQIWVNIDIL
jgi:hypothetical protein